MDYIVKPSSLNGEISAPPSKSCGHRGIICGGLAGNSVIKNISLSEDIKATIDCMKALGAEIKIEGSTVYTREFKPKQGKLLCRESGSTLRFLIPITLALLGEGEFSGYGRLMERPLLPYFEIFDKMGITYNMEGNTLKIKGRLTPDEFNIRGDVSSQFVTGLLYALPLIGGGRINITTPLESTPYVDITIDILKEFGIDVLNHNYKRFEALGNYKSSEFTTEGDFSQAAFFLAAGAMGGKVSVSNLREDSVQGDKEIINILKRFGADIKGDRDTVTAVKSDLYGIEIDAAEIPDLVPILSCVAAVAKGKTRIYNAGRLRIKESDRLQTTAEGLSNMGIKVTEDEDFLEIYGGEPVGGEIDSFADHRIAMSFAILALCAKGETLIRGGNCVSKSLPNFWEIIKDLGGDINGVTLR